MRRTFFITTIGVLSLVGALLWPTTTAQGAAGTSSPKPRTVKVHKVGSAHLEPGAGEIKPDPDAESEAAGGHDPVRNGHVGKKVVPPGPSGVTPSQPSLAVSHSESGWQGIDHFDQRFTDGGNQFSTEPPDQGLCVGNGHVFEAVNTAVRSYSTSGAPQSTVISLNQFFFGDHEYNRTTGVESPHSLGDPSCVYDAGSNRFFLTVYDLAEDSDGNLLGPAFVDIAVSPAGTTLGTWSIYQMDVTNDGTDGTPSRPGCPCFADYPHPGTDANGFYVSTNEYGTLDESVDHGAVVYAMDKAALANGTGTVPGAVLDTRRQDLYQGTYYNGFTLAPALSSGSAYAPNTMYFLSSDAITSDAGPNAVKSGQILLWKIANTSAISSNPTSLRLTHVTVSVATYTVPPQANQKAGPVPLADCVNQTACAKTVLAGKPNKFKAVEGPLDVNDSRMLQSAYAHGHLWGALDTAVDIGGATKAGVAYYVVNPNGSLVKQGTLAVAGNHITYPALGVTSAGRGVMTMTLTGNNYYPSAGYVRVDDVVGQPASGLTVAGMGVGPQDGFSEYKAFGPPYRARWGDYGAASVVGNTVWIASEYIAQSCTFAEFQADMTCGDTRSSIANWSTHIASVTP